MDKLNLQTPDLTTENVKRIQQLFPSVVKESEDEEGNKVYKVDIDLLRAELGDTSVTEGLEERYRLDWPGKKRSILKANTPIDKTLRPVKKDSVDWDNTGNLYIEGDNFEVLKALQESYLGKIKMIYIDPPYNTGNDFVYNDNFAEDSEEYKERTEQNAEGYKMVKNMESNGRFHSDWLSMMYERIKVARDFLAEDGVMFISINDIEVHNLRKICDEIFGEDGFVDCICVVNNLKGNHNDTYFKTAHENLLVYKKDNFTLGTFRLEQDELDEYKLKDEFGYYKQGAYFRKTGNVCLREERPNEYYPIYVGPNDEISLEPKEGYDAVTPKTQEGKDGCRRWSPERLKDNLSELMVNKSGKDISFYIKQRLAFEDDVRGKSPKTVFYKKEYNNGAGKSTFIDLFGEDVFSSYPKSLELMKDIIEISTKKNSVIMDFFSGSATTAHACMQLNAEDGGNRKYIMVQLPELCDEDSRGYKAGYKNICDIGKERIRRAAKKIKEDKGAEIDYGFRVYRVDDSCLKDVDSHPSEIRQEDLFNNISNIKEDRTPEDLLTQVILSLGLTLDLPIEEKTIKNNKVFYVAGNSLVACFDENVDFGIVEEIAKDQPLKLVFRDASFRSDADRINVENTMKRLSENTIVKVI